MPCPHPCSFCTRLQGTFLSDLSFRVIFYQIRLQQSAAPPLKTKLTQTTRDTCCTSMPRASKSVLIGTWDDPDRNTCMSSVSQPVCQCLKHKFEILDSNFQAIQKHSTKSTLDLLMMVILSEVCVVKQ